MSRFIFLPSFAKKSDVSFHKKSEYSGVDFKFQERIQYSYMFKETPNSNLHQISLRSEYTFTTADTKYFCRFDVVSPFEINKYLIDLTKEDFKELAEVHIQNCNEEFHLTTIEFPDGFSLVTENDNVNDEYIAVMLVDYRTLQNTINN